MANISFRNLTFQIKAHTEGSQYKNTNFPYGISTIETSREYRLELERKLRARMPIISFHSCSHRALHFQPHCQHSLQFPFFRTIPHATGTQEIIFKFPLS